jgi:hypothetical protein
MWYGFHDRASGCSDDWQGLLGAVVMCRCLGHGRKVGGGKLPVCAARCLAGRETDCFHVSATPVLCSEGVYSAATDAGVVAGCSVQAACVGVAGGGWGSTLQHAHSSWPSRGRHTWPVGCYHPACTCHCSCSLRAGKHPCRPVGPRWAAPPPPGGPPGSPLLTLQAHCIAWLG